MTYAERILDELDASVFSGDTFYNREDLENLKYHLKRWNKEVLEIEQVVNQSENTEDDDE